MVTRSELYKDFPGIGVMTINGSGEIVIPFSTACYTHSYTRHPDRKSIIKRQWEHEKLYGHLHFDDYYKLYEIFEDLLFIHCDKLKGMSYDDIIVYLNAEAKNGMV